MTGASSSLDIYAEGRRLRRCPRCDLWLPNDRFSKDASSPSGLQTRCRGCQSQLKRERRGSAREREIRRKENTGVDISESDWQLAFAAQGQRCAICETSGGPISRWATDHDHQSGRFRGILCFRCNAVIVKGAESPHLAAALRYIGRTDLAPQPEVLESVTSGGEAA